MEEAISLQEVFKVLRTRLVLILSITILSVSIGGALSYFYLEPIYEASTQILVNRQTVGQNEFNSQDIQMNLQLIDTYDDIIKSPAILSKVIENLNLDATPALLYSQITVNSRQNSQVVNVIVQDPEQKRAVDIANMTAEVFQEEIQLLMNVDNVNIFSPAVYVKNPSPVKPNPILNMAIAAVVGLMIGVGLAFLIDLLDTTVKTERDIEELTELSILGLISPISKKDIEKTREAVRRKRRGIRLWPGRKKSDYKQRGVSL